MYFNIKVLLKPYKKNRAHQQAEIFGCIRNFRLLTRAVPQRYWNFCKSTFTLRSSESAPEYSRQRARSTLS
jgi:hypothetical protein